MLTDNKNKNESIKSEIENKISTLETLDNKKIVQEEIEDNITQTNIKNENISINKKDIYIFAIIGLSILLLILILIVEAKKKNRRNVNGR